MRTSYAAGQPAGELARRLPGDPQGRPLPGVPPGRVQRDDGLARRARRPGRDLERHAVLLAAVGPRPHVIVAAPRARPDVGDDAAAARSPGSATRSSLRVAPPLYRRTPIVTLSESSKTELVDELGFPADRVTSCRPASTRVLARAARTSPTPLVVAVGRLVPVKRFDVLIDALRRGSSRVVPDLSGDRRRGLRARALETADAPHGRRRLDALRAGPSATTSCVDLYRAAWVVASASAREGWGMTITEAAACGTPAVATRIAGHTDAVVDGRQRAARRRRARAAPPRSTAVLRRRRVCGPRSRQGALEHASRFTWGATARGTLEVLAAEAPRRRHRAPHGRRR